MQDGRSEISRFDRYTVGTIVEETLSILFLDYDYAVVEIALDEIRSTTELQ